METRRNHLWGFHKVSNTGNLGGILGLTISRCGNSWNHLWGFHKFSNKENLGGIPRLTVPSCGNSWKPPMRFPQSFQCRKSMWNPHVDCSRCGIRRNHLWGFPKVSNDENLGRILWLTVPRCGNSWKPPVRFPQSFQCRKSSRIPQADCSKVWKFVETTCGVSPKFPKQGI